MYDSLIAVTDRKLVRGDFLDQIRRVCQHRPRALVLREKDLSPEVYTALARQVRSICEEYHVPFVAHAHVEVVDSLGVSRLHLPLVQLRQLTGRPEVVQLGTSCHSVADMQEAAALGCTYIFLGNIFETQCKPGLPGRGVALLREVCEKSSIPVYGIGGITPQNLPQLLSVGAAGGCMMSGFMRL